MWWSTFPLFVCALVAAAAPPTPSFMQIHDITNGPRERLTGCDLKHNAYYMNSAAGRKEQKLIKRNLNSKNIEWVTTYAASEAERPRELVAMFDQQGNYYQVGHAVTEANTVYFRKFRGTDGELMFAKRLLPCPGYNSDYTKVDATSSDNNVFGITVTCEYRDQTTRKSEVVVYGMDTNGEELYKYYDLSGRLFARIRNDGNIFVIDTANIGENGNFEGVYVYKIDAKTGKKVAEPYLFKAGLGQKPENAEEAALLTTVASGLGVNDTLAFEFPTDITGINFVSDIYLQKGTDAMFVIARDIADEGPTYLGAFDKESGDLLTWIDANQGTPLNLFVDGNRVAVISFDVEGNDELTVWDFLP